MGYYGMPSIYDEPNPNTHQNHPGIISNAFSSMSNVIGGIAGAASNLWNRSKFCDVANLVDQVFLRVAHV